MPQRESSRLQELSRRWRAFLRRHRYRTPWFVLAETLAAFRRHNGLSLSASLSFYALFALIPMALLLFFLMSHLVFSSDYAIVELAIITSNLVPKLSSLIMVEVYNLSQQQALWGVFGTLALLWTVTPLAGALRAAFHTISSLVDHPSLLRKAAKDTLTVVGMLLLLMLFTFGALMLEKVLDFFRPDFVSASAVNNLSSVAMSTVMLAVFYQAFFPGKVLLRHLLLGSLLTSLMWLAMRPAFAVMLSVNPSYGAVFGGMKGIFISIGWLYYNVAVFLLGTELIATLHKKDILLLKELFSGRPLQEAQLAQLKSHFGHEYRQGDVVFHAGDKGDNLYYIVSGSVTIAHDSAVLRQPGAGEYFGEMAVFTKSARIADARISSDSALLLGISAGHMEALLQEDPSLARMFLHDAAARLRQASGTISAQQ